MKRVLIIILLTLSVIYVPSKLNAQNQDIQTIVDQVCGDSIFAHIAVLQKMDRMFFNKNRESTDYLLNYLQNCELDSSYLQELFEDIPSDSGQYPPNVVAVKYGTLMPETIHIIGAHYDAPWAFIDTGDSIRGIPCPGADDNASGTAGVLEAARILSDYNFKTTILFILFSGEETGMHGSEAVAEKAIQENWNLSAVLNMDMIAYSRDGDDIDVSIKRDTQSRPISVLCANAISAYVPELDYEYASDEFGDHISFWNCGFPAITFMDEYDRESINFNPYIHTIEDTLGLSANSKILAELITKAAVSTLMLLDESVISIVDGPSAIQKVEDYKLLQNYPNPFNPSTKISYSTPNSDFVTLRVYDMLGREIQTLVNEFQQPSTYSINFDASSLSSGIYFYRLQVGKDFVETKKMMLMR